MVYESLQEANQELVKGILEGMLKAQLLKSVYDKLKTNTSSMAIHSKAYIETMGGSISISNKKLDILLSIDIYWAN